MEKIKALKLTDIKGWDPYRVYSEQYTGVAEGEIYANGFILSDCQSYLIVDSLDTMNINPESKNIENAISMGAEVCDVFYVRHSDECYLGVFEEYNAIEGEYSYFEGEMGAIFVNEEDARNYEYFVEKAMKFVENARGFSEEEIESLLEFAY